MRPDGLAENFYFGGGSTVTTLTPVTWGVLLLASVIIFVLPRRYVIAPFLLVGLLLTTWPQLVVGGMHLAIYRMLIMAGWLRMLLRRDRDARPMSSLDKAVLAWAIVNAVMYSLLWGADAIGNRLGFLLNTCGTYFLARYLIRDREDILRGVKILAVVSLVIAGFMVNEHATGHNAFSIMGGVPEISDARAGGFRAQGPFAHSIVAGTFGAVLLPLFVALWWAGSRSRLLAVCGVASSVAIVFSSASSTPLATLAAGVLGLIAWPLRRRMSLVRWGLVICAIAGQLAMNSPIWFLMARLGGSIGGTGWHRSQLIDQFIRHFGDWWLTGTRNNASWGLDMWDAINAFVNAGVGGGMITLALFVAVLVCAFKSIGRARLRFEGDWPYERLLWAMGATLFANLVAFFGIIYYDQSNIMWLSFLAMISTVSYFNPRESAEEDFDMMAEPDAARVYSEMNPTAVGYE